LASSGLIPSSFTRRFTRELRIGEVVVVHGDGVGGDIVGKRDTVSIVDCAPAGWDFDPILLDSLSHGCPFPVLEDLELKKAGEDRQSR
jgi:hypothetical protein